MNAFGFWSFSDKIILLAERFPLGVAHRQKKKKVLFHMTRLSSAVGKPLRFILDCLQDAIALPEAQHSNRLSQIFWAGHTC